jgi:hypothetical protein
MSLHESCGPDRLTRDAATEWRQALWGRVYLPGWRARRLSGARGGEDFDHPCRCAVCQADAAAIREGG